MPVQVQNHNSSNSPFYIHKIPPEWMGRALHQALQDSHLETFKRLFEFAVAADYKVSRLHAKEQPEMNKKSFNASSIT